MILNYNSQLINPLFDLSNNVIILTGAGGLLGTKYAEGLSQVNANVVLADKNYSKVKQMEKTLIKV